ncbi:hypothetical protein RZS08_56795, partial [Arthrospira platensis SPKY1]|nr:hypothetical protein [Arthrospira platensis SPKY1]
MFTRLSSTVLAPIFCVLAGLLVYAVGPQDPGLRTGLALFTLIGSLWMTQAFPLSVTALMVPLLAAITGVLTVR